MKRVKQTKLPNYIRKLHYLARIGAIPTDVGVHMIDIAHDHWCAIYRQERCDCDPDITLKVTVPKNMN